MTDGSAASEAWGAPMTFLRPREGAYIAIDNRQLDGEEYRRHTAVVWMRLTVEHVSLKNLNWCRGDLYEIPDEWTGWTEDGGTLVTPRGEIELRWATRERLLDPPVDAAVNDFGDALSEAGKSDEEVERLLTSGTDDEVNAACDALCNGEPY